jgi:branched-chain amino acid transport system ATP-binding protein
VQALRWRFATVDGADFEVQGGDLGIAGLNGKTLFDVVTGISHASDGLVLFSGEQIQDASVHRICHLGISRTFQLPSVFDSQTALANVLAGAQFGDGTAWWKALRVSASVREAAQAELEFVGLADRSAALAGPMPVFDKKRLMIARRWPRRGAVPRRAVGGLRRRRWTSSSALRS